MHTHALMRCDIWRETIFNLVTEQGFMSFIYKELLQINKKKNPTKMKNWTKKGTINSCVKPHKWPLERQ